MNEKIKFILSKNAEVFINLLWKEVINIKEMLKFLSSKYVAVKYLKILILREIEMLNKVMLEE